MSSGDLCFLKTRGLNSESPWLFAVRWTQTGGSYAKWEVLFEVFEELVAHAIGSNQCSGFGVTLVVQLDLWFVRCEGLLEGLGGGPTPYCLRPIRRKLRSVREIVDMVPQCCATEQGTVCRGG
jgi:hypothetical protein